MERSLRTDSDTPSGWRGSCSVRAGERDAWSHQETRFCHVWNRSSGFVVTAEWTRRADEAPRGVAQDGAAGVVICKKVGSATADSPARSRPRRRRPRRGRGRRRPLRRGDLPARAPPAFGPRPPGSPDFCLRPAAVQEARRPSRASRPSAAGRSMLRRPMPNSAARSIRRLVGRREPGKDQLRRTELRKPFSLSEAGVSVLSRLQVG